MSDPSQDSMLFDVAAIADNDAWAVGFVGNNTLAMHWDGKSWTQVPTPNPGYAVVERSLEAVAALGPNDVWAAGTAEMNIPPYGYISEAILIMHWDGKSWELVLPPGWPAGWGSSFIYTIEAIAPDDVWFAGEGPYNTAYPGALAIHWDGKTLQQVPTETFDTNCGGSTFGCGHAITDMSAIASNDIWAVGQAGDGDSSQVSQIWHWDGSTWAHTPGPAPGIWHSLSAVAAFAPNDVWALGGVFDVNQGVILHWDGTQWNEVPAPVNNFEGIIPIAPDDIWSHWGELVHYDGTTWSIVPQAGTPAQWGIAAGAHSGECDAWMVGFEIGTGPYYINPYTQRLQRPDLRPMPGDVTGDQLVNVDDLLAVINAWGPCPSPPASCSADIHQDNAVNVDDLLIVINNWSV